MSIRLRLVLSLLILNGLGFYLLAYWIRTELRPRYLEGIEDSLIEFATVTAAMVGTTYEQEQDPNRWLNSSFEKVYQRRFEARIYEVLKTQVDVRVYITDTNGIIIFDSKNQDVGANFSRWNDVARTLKGHYGARATRLIANNPYSSVMYVAAPIFAYDKLIGSLTVAKPPETMNIFIKSAQEKITAVGLISTLVLVLIAVFVPLLITRPIHRLKDYALAIAEGRKPDKLHFSSPELVGLAQAFEHMRDTLEGKQYIETYVQNLTHEIKAPLAGIRSAAELLQENLPEADRAKFLNNIRTESNRLQDITEKLLGLAEVERSKELAKRTAIDLQQIIQAVIAAYEPTLQLRRQTIAFQQPTHWPPQQGDTFLLQLAITNLVSNAVDFANEGSTIVIDVVHRERTCQISVENIGPHIPDYALTRLFDRFYSLPRPSSGRKGTGLGLSFVQEIARLHGGRANLVNTATGVRATLTIS